ncbi:MAG TPA: MaoC family dehydratase [Caulobacteraceae bacterium]|nr:MaoC family dehydratase [Caulobacteraceae bacterium]
MDRDALTVGQSAERTFEITDARVRAFAEVSEDRNPVHLDETYAAGTMFKGRVAHGMLLGGFISAVLGQDLPGEGSIYLGQTLEFLHPVRIGDQVRVTVTVIEAGRARARLQTLCRVGDVVVCQGEAAVVPPRRRRGGQG